MDQAVRYRDGIRDLIVFLIRSSAGATILFFIMATTSNPILFTELEIGVMAVISIGISLFGSAVSPILGFNPSSPLQVISTFGIKWSVLCSICFSVYFLFFSYFIWWLAFLLAPSLRQRVRERGRRICLYTGGDTVWGISATSTIPITSLTHFTLYAPLMPKVALYLTVVVPFLIDSWQSDQLGLSLIDGVLHHFGNSTV